MADKLLKITKPDKTVHAMPISNKAFWQAYNNRLADHEKVKIEEISEKEGADLPFIDEKYVSPAEAVSKVSDLQKENEILRKQLEASKAK